MRTLCDRLVNGWFHHVEGGKLMAGLDEIRCHRSAHIAKPDKPDAHGVPPVRARCGWVIGWISDAVNPGKEMT
jgi:hypothetical protein